jgi:hypothetical protein
VILNNRAVRTDFNLPKTICVPWFGVNEGEIFPIKDVHPLCIPFKLTDNIFVLKVIQNPVPEGVRPAFELVFDIIVREFEPMTLELLNGLWDEKGTSGAQR